MWERHEEKWPASESSRADASKSHQADASADQAGSWRGESGRRLEVLDNGKVDSWCDHVASGEPVITNRVRAVEQVSPGALAGQQFRLKGRDRLKEKVASVREGAPGADIDRVMANIHDAVRYTFEYGESGYAQGTQDDVSRLQSQGFELTKMKNLWASSEYKGINSQWLDRQTGQSFEVQFHTTASFEGKQITHHAYERLRVLRMANPESADLHAFQRDVCEAIPVPPRAQEIPDYP
ncbi:MAG TPA: hypothetical protein VG253_09045 [Streptosporangiaceae bacterium]|jgi:hypothetical protein|nr:hypothetical protein [Streptosporangiaceae bacterium]